MTVTFLQVRLDSTRLPRKALERLGSKTIVECCLEALSRLDVDRRVLVTEPDSARELEPFARRLDWELFVGSKKNVLDRFVQAARWCSAQTIIRATGDNPLVSAHLAGRLLEEHRAQASDYSGYLGIPVGSGVEIVQTSALERAWHGSPDEYEQEHVSPYLYRRPRQFVIHRPDITAPFRAPEARVTLDTADDLVYLRSLWHELYTDHPLELEEILPWLNRHPR